MKLTVNMLSQNSDTPLTAAHGPLRVGWNPHHVADGASPNSSTVQRRKETAFGVVYPNKLYKKPYLSESFHLPLACHCHFLSCRPGKHPTLLQTDLPQAGGNIQAQLSTQHIVFLPVMHTTEISIAQENSWAPDTLFYAKCKTYVKVP